MINKLLKNKVKKEANKITSKGSSGFSRDRDMIENQIIAVWGSPGSGKTTLTLKMAEYLANKKKNVIIVHDDVACPVISTVVDLKNQEEKSIGKVLSGNIEQSVIKDNLVTLERNNYIAMLGYAKGENYRTYPTYVKEIVNDLLLQVRHLADYVIIDCSSNIKDNIFTDTVLEKADRVVSLSTSDLKGLSYFNSTLPMLIDRRYNTGNHLNVVSNIRDFEAKETVNDILKGKGIYLDFTDEITNQTIERRLFETMINKESTPYKEGLNKIMEELIYG